MNRLQEALHRWQASFPGRTWARYTAARGNVLAGGIAYFAFFSIFPALALGFTALGLVLGDDNALQRELAGYVNRSLGAEVIGLPGSEGGLVPIDVLIRSSALTFSAVAGSVVLVFTGLGWLDAMRQGIRAVFGAPGGGNPVVGKLRDLGTLATFGVAVLASAVASVVVTAASSQVLDALGLEGGVGRALVRVTSALALLVIDTGIFLVLFRGLSGVPVPLQHLWQGALAGGVALGLLKVFGGLLLSQLSDNPFYAAFAVVVGLLVWMNLVGRLTLLAASWAATRAADAGRLPALLPGQEAPGGAAPDDAAADAPDGVPDVPGRTATARARAAAVAATPTYGVRAADRTTLAAGVVLGLTGAYVLRVGRGAVRAVAGAFRD